MEEVEASGADGSRMGMRRFGTRVLLVLAGTLVSVVVIEIGFRAFQPERAFRAASELTNFRLNEADLTRFFEIDPEFGFRPILGNAYYDRHGTQQNEYTLDRRPGMRRLLFLGDSVTARGRIVAALRTLLGDDRFEYWNAGVESFNTVQEVNYFLRYNAGTRPDHVILTFHLNDFGTTPIAFLDTNGALVVYSPHRPLREVSPWLFQHSYTYRLFLGLSCGRNPEGRGVIDEVRESLTLLRDELDRSSTRLTVALLPTLLSLEDWSEEDRRRREIILEILANLEIEYVDLLRPLEEALEDGVAVTEFPGDVWHPSSEVSKYFARHIRRHAKLGL